MARNSIWFVSKVMRLGLVISIAAIAIGCSQRRELKERWQCLNLPVSVYEDGVASLVGKRAAWKAVGDGAIRLEYQEDDQAKIAELRITGKDEAGQRTATLRLDASELDCTELPPAKK